MKLVQLMYDYQKKNDIKGRCITNSIYVRDYMKTNKKNATMKAVIAVGKVGKNDMMVGIHMVVELEGIIIDPSYEISQHNLIYVDSFSKAMALSKGATYIDGYGLSKKELIKEFLYFIEVAKKINDDIIENIDMDYYMAQGEYVKKMLYSSK